MLRESRFREKQQLSRVKVTHYSELWLGTYWAMLLMFLCDFSESSKQEFVLLTSVLQKWKMSSVRGLSTQTRS